jgi:hypothetical protein
MREALEKVQNLNLEISEELDAYIYRHARSSCECPGSQNPEVEVALC